MWEEFKDYFCDDLPYRLRVQGLNGKEIPYEMHNPHLNYGLCPISDHFATRGKVSGDHVLPEPTVKWKDKVQNNLIIAGLSIDFWEGDEELQSMVTSPNAE